MRTKQQLTIELTMGSLQNYFNFRKVYQKAGRQLLLESINRIKKKKKIVKENIKWEKMRKKLGDYMYFSKVKNEQLQGTLRALRNV